MAAPLPAEIWNKILGYATGTTRRILSLALCLRNAPSYPMELEELTVSVDLLRWALSGGMGRVFSDTEIMESAARNGSVSCLRFLRSLGFPWGRAPALVFASGNVEAVKWVRLSVPRCSSGDEERFAAEGGHRHLLEWLRDRGELTGVWSEGAATGGRVDLLKDPVDPVISPETLDCAIEAENAEILEYLLSSRPVMDPGRLLILAARKGWLEGALIILNHGAVPGCWALAASVRSGRQEIFDLILSRMGTNPIISFL